MHGGLVLYGFDARVPLDGSPPEWSPDRRAGYLVRPDVARPVSVDRAVWPPVQPAAAPGNGAHDYWSTDHWSSLADLRTVCRRAGFGRESCSLVALGVADNRGAAANALLLGTPLSAGVGWRSLGYDVADTGLTSGLSNCGFVPGLDDVEAMRARWAPRLNEHGLFDALRDADEFRALSDTRVSEHAPFLVHQLQLVPW